MRGENYHIMITSEKNIVPEVCRASYCMKNFYSNTGFILNKPGSNEGCKSGKTRIVYKNLFQAEINFKSVYSIRRLMLRLHSRVNRLYGISKSICSAGF